MAADAPFMSDTAVLAALIELKGLGKALDLLGVPPDLKRDLKAMERRNGLQAVIEVLGSFLYMANEVMPPDPIPPGPRPPHRRPAVKGESPADRRAEDRDQDVESPNQLDLF